jgi:AraC-like DNA-binding protein
MVNSNTKYVSQIINETYDKNFRTYINEYRVKEARKRLMEEKYGNYTIQGIAESVGYKSSTNFILAFKKTTGITPSLYQKLVKTDKSRSSEPEYPE